ncbi:hypothetical protein GPECTOR_1200g461 [Gonium pectorale]|uniref:Uncharacterized protein n=1 Tax=Gonium pectorale TaxID=33097 RepID=A0A150FTL7_GONPE|nr:hypothetical protein GPECTOR_1200g461 [Gonium pectorale]|eukprot:KXZ40952.1 hypothetical protein GPECTOR_1200g461 [Gonium pectorale]
MNDNGAGAGDPDRPNEAAAAPRRPTKEYLIAQGFEESLAVFLADKEDFDLPDVECLRKQKLKS